MSDHICDKRDHICDHICDKRDHICDHICDKSDHISDKHTAEYEKGGMFIS